MAKQVLTYQIGNFSNNVGAHFWNFQHEDGFSVSDTDYNVLLRNSMDPKSRWKPRVILVDLKDSLHGLSDSGSMRARGAVAHAKERVFADRSFANSHIELHEQSPGASCELSDCWADSLTCDLHPNSLQLIREYYGSSSEYKFALYGLGKQMCEKGLFMEEMDDKLHFWIEECDNLDGFQLLLDAHDAFSGIGGSIIGNLRDEFPSKSRLAYVNWPMMVRQSNLDAKLTNYVLTVNLALAIADLHEHATSYSLQSLRTNILSTSQQLLQVPGVDATPETNGSASALLAETVAAISSPWQLSESSFALSDFCAHVSQGTGRIFATSFGVLSPCNLSEGSSFLERAVANGGYIPGISSCLMPYVEPPLTELLSLSVFARSISLGDLRPREISPSLLARLQVYRDVFTDGPYSLIRTLTELLYSGSGANLVSYIPAPRKDFVRPNLEDRSSSRRNSIKRYQESFCCAFGTRKSENLFAVMLDNLSELKLSKFHWLQELGLDKDSFLELQNTLASVRSSFHPERLQEDMDVGS